MPPLQLCTVIIQSGHWGPPCPIRIMGLTIERWAYITWILRNPSLAPNMSNTVGTFSKLVLLRWLSLQQHVQILYLPVDCFLCLAFHCFIEESILPLDSVHPLLFFWNINILNYEMIYSHFITNLGWNWI